MTEKEKTKAIRITKRTILEDGVQLEIKATDNLHSVPVDYWPVVLELRRNFIRREVASLCRTLRRFKTEIMSSRACEYFGTNDEDSIWVRAYDIDPLFPQWADDFAEMAENTPFPFRDLYGATDEQN